MLGQTLRWLVSWMFNSPMVWGGRARYLNSKMVWKDYYIVLNCLVGCINMFFFFFFFFSLFQQYVAKCCKILRVPSDSLGFKILLYWTVSNFLYPWPLTVDMVMVVMGWPYDSFDRILYIRITKYWNDMISYKINAVISGFLKKGWPTLDLQKRQIWVGLMFGGCGRWGLLKKNSFKSWRGEGRVIDSCQLPVVLLDPTFSRLILLLSMCQHR